jgi:Cupin-like domain
VPQLPAPQAIREFSSLDRDAIRREVLPDKQPTVLRGFVSDWPAVRHGSESPDALIRYLSRFDNGQPVDAQMTPSQADSQRYYNEAMTGINFIRNRVPLAALIEQVLRYAQFPDPPAVAAQSALIRDSLPGFAEENRLSLVDDGVLPRLWLGNRITTPTHLDEWNNIGCVVAGRRRFTLFPPEQIENLYIGPLDFGHTGAPMSVVSLRNPDLERFPKFRKAVEAAVTAELRPGDAIVIPPLWWHHVESLDSFNMLVNYWWNDDREDVALADSGFDALLHGILSVHALPPATRRAWGALFQHFVFGDETAATGHIPAERRGILGALSAQQKVAVRAQLMKRLSRR